MVHAEGLAKRITELFCREQLDLSARPGAPTPGWDSMPEVAAANQLRVAGASDAEVRLYITFTAALDRARDADLLWKRAAEMFARIRWPFSPELVMSHPLSELQDALRSHRVSQRHSLDSSGWRTIAETLANPDLAPHAWTTIYKGRGDAPALRRELFSQERGKPRFPFLRGPKVGPMWIRMLAYPGRAAITSLEILPVAIDVQVRKVTEYLGMTETFGQDLERVRTLIQAKWAEDVRLHGTQGPNHLAGTASALDPALWFYAKWGCTWCERRGRKVPISELCRECVFDEIRHPRPRPGGS